CEISVEPAILREQGEQLAIGPRLAEAAIGRHVGGDIEHCLEGELDRVLDESPFPDVGVDEIRSRLLAKIAETRLDEAKPLRDQRLVSHAGLLARRYSSR